jgi:hypothetical protein
LAPAPPKSEPPAAPPELGVLAPPKLKDMLLLVCYALCGACGRVLDPSSDVWYKKSSWEKACKSWTALNGSCKVSRDQERMGEGVFVVGVFKRRKVDGS